MSVLRIVLSDDSTSTYQHLGGSREEDSVTGNTSGENDVRSSSEGEVGATRKKGKICQVSEDDLLV